MDGLEKRVFRRKHALLSTLLKPAPVFMDILKQQGIVSASMEQSFRATDDREKMPALLLMMESGTFTKIVFMLEQTGLSWVADEIHADLLYEQGKLTLEDYILQEAKYTANTLLGDTGFIDTKRKGDLVQSIASRHQVAKEAWKRQMNRKTKRVVRELQTVQQDVLKMFQDVDVFLKAKRKADRNGVESTSESDRVIQDIVVVGDDAVNYGMAVRMLQTKITTLSRVLEDEIRQHEELRSERERCFDILNVEPSADPLDETLQIVLAKFSRELGQNASDTASKNRQVTALDKQVRGLKQNLSSQITDKNTQLDLLNRTIKQTERSLRDTREDLTDMTKKRDIYKAQAAYWKDRSEMLEKTRRLGYYHISKVSHPVSLVSAKSAQLGHSRRNIYYDSQLLELSDNVVYIKGEDLSRWNLDNADGTGASSARTVIVGGYDSKSETRMPSSTKTAQSVQQAPGSKSVVRSGPGSSRAVSQYHAQCTSSDNINMSTYRNSGNSNNSNNNNNNNNNNNKSYGMNSKGVLKGYLKPTKSTTDRSQNAFVQETGVGVNKRQSSYSRDSKGSADVKTSGLNQSPYSSQVLPVYPYLGQTTVTTTSKDSNAGQQSHSMRPAQVLPSGVYRSAHRPPVTYTQGPSTGEMDDWEYRVRMSWLTPNGYINYTNGMPGLDRSTQTSRPGSETTSTSTTRNHTNIVQEMTPKEKFDEAVSKETRGPAGIPNQANSSFQLIKGASNTDDFGQSITSVHTTERSSGYSSAASGRVSEAGTGGNVPRSVSAKRQRSVTFGDSDLGVKSGKHCGCCSDCQGKPATSHPYQDYIS